MTRLDAALQAFASRPVPTQGHLQLPHAESQERTIYIHPTDARALVEPTRDGNDYRRICARHQWSSDVVPRFQDLGECLECVAEIEGAAGRRRYAALHGEHVRIVGTV